MEAKSLESMSLEELWRLHTVVNDILAARLVAKKAELERRLEPLRRGDNTPKTGSKRGSKEVAERRPARIGQIKFSEQARLRAPFASRIRFADRAPQLSRTAPDDAPATQAASARPQSIPLASTISIRNDRMSLDASDTGKSTGAGERLKRAERCVARVSRRHLPARPKTIRDIPRHEGHVRKQLQTQASGPSHFFSGNSRVKVAEPRFELPAPNAVTAT